MVKTYTIEIKFPNICKWVRRIPIWLGQHCKIYGERRGIPNASPHARISQATKTKHHQLKIGLTEQEQSTDVVSTSSCPPNLAVSKLS